MTDKNDKHLNLNDNALDSLEFQNDFKREMLTINTTEVLYEKTKRRIEHEVKNDRPSRRAKRPKSFYLSIAASAACIILIGTLFLSHSDFYYLGRTSEDHDAVYDYLPAANEAEVFQGLAQETPDQIIPNDHFLSFDDIEHAIDFYDSILSYKDSGTDTDNIERSEGDYECSFIETVCTSGHHSSGLLHGSLLSRSIPSAVLNISNQLLLVPTDDRVYLIDVSDPYNTETLSSIHLNLRDANLNIVCVSNDYLFSGDYLWVFYSFADTVKSLDDSYDNYQPSQFTRVVVYDLSNPSHPLLIDSYDVDGRYLASETDGTSVVVLFEKYIANRDFASDQFVLPHTRSNSNVWEMMDAQYLSHIRSLTPDSFVIISRGASDLSEYPTIVAVSGSFHQYHFDENRLILFGSEQYEDATIYAQWNPQHISIGMEPNNPLLFLS